MRWRTAEIHSGVDASQNRTLDLFDGAPHENRSLRYASFKVVRLALSGACAGTTTANFGIDAIVKPAASIFAPRGRFVRREFRIPRFPDCLHGVGRAFHARLTGFLLVVRRACAAGDQSARVGVVLSGLTQRNSRIQPDHECLAMLNTSGRL